MLVNKEKLLLAMANACLNPIRLCERAKIQYQTFVRITNNKPCKPATLGKIAKALGVHAEDLYDGNEIQP